VTYRVSSLVCVGFASYAGCGNAPRPAASDAAVATDAGPDGNPGAITVSFVRGGSPVAGVPIVSQDASGAVVASTTTGADGNAVLSSERVAMITAVDADDTQLYTAVGVAAGDHIVIPVSGSIATFGQLAVTLPPAPTGAVGYEVLIGDDLANATAITAPITVAATGLDVGSDGTITVIGLARDASYNIIAVSTATGVVPPATGTTANVTTAAWQTASSPFVLGVAHGTLGDLVNTTNGQNIGGVEFALPSLSGNTGHIRWWPVPALGGYVDYSAQIPFGSTTTGSPPAKRFVARRLAASATADDVDLDAILPGLTGTAVDAGDLARPTLSWTAAAPTGSADGVLLNTRWNGSHYGQWAFMLPPGQTSVRMPALPAELAAWIPDAPIAAPYAVLVDTTFDADYAAFRGDGFGLLDGPAFLHDGEGTLLGSSYFPSAF